ncbi:flavodoxin family protein [Megasphaera sp.]|uniref:flavodoxin family protein n=1 Tax=Megasphaera TaxID=906 RepID=UPI001D1FF668|nr:flavodoxin family protein [Megasphaera sp.]MBS6790919.1 flavodoxin family protein [Megasphaera sp.]
MKTIVLYSSRTGNTKKVAQAVAGALPAGTPCLPVAEAPSDIEAYDLVFLGYWVDRGTANAEAKQFLEGLRPHHVALFATLGADPKSAHAQQSLDEGARILPEGTDVVGTFICQGAVDPKIIEMMYKQFPAGHPHGRTPERDARHAEAAKHPDEADLKEAADFAAAVLQRLEGGGQ